MSARLAVFGLAVALTSAVDISNLKLPGLKKFLFVRGVECEKCTSKADFAAAAEEVLTLAPRYELEKEWAAQQEYKKNVKDFKITREEFLLQLN